MISIELIRSQPDAVRSAIRKRGGEAPIDQLLEVDARRRASIAEADRLRARRNEVSRQLGRTKERPPELIAEMRAVGSRIKALATGIKELEDELHEMMLGIPNIPDDSVPVGPDDDANLLLRTVGAPPEFDFEPLPHWELGERLGIIDFSRGVKLSGSRFYVLNGKGARLQRALISWMLDLHAEEHGYVELYLPDLVSRDTATASGQLPKFADTMYRDDEDDLWMIPTAEVPIANLFRDEILDLSECSAQSGPFQVPISFVAHTPCFRREKAAAGRDTRGIKRVHQFEKVELFKFVEPEASGAALEQLVADAERVCERLGIRHRVQLLSSGSMGGAAAKTYDVETWAPGLGEWLEVSSCSNCTDYQARRARVRYRPERGAQPRFVHTLNGSGLGIPRVMISIMETYQQADGGIVVPPVLRPYTGFDRID